MSTEVRSVTSLAMLYAFRMLGLFMVLPILVLYGKGYLGATPFTLGLALGVYGLTQALFQIPLGLMSDIFGRKLIIISGLVIFAAGSLVAAFSTTVEGLIVGRALQGSGAIASAIMATVADLTSEQNRTKAMAAIGASIGLSFTLAMVIGPSLAAIAGMDGVFILSAVLSVVGILIVLFFVPTPPRFHKSHRDTGAIPSLILATIKNGELFRLNWGIFSLHCVLMASFVVLPGLLQAELGLDKAEHWRVYLPVLLLSFVSMLPFMLLAERKRQVKTVFLGAIFAMAACLFFMGVFSGNGYWLVFLVFIFFVAFNLLEATLPSLVSKIAPVGSKGTAMGIYSTSQFLGAFFGGALGGALMGYQSSGEFLFFCCATLVVVWGALAWTMAKPKYLSSLCYSIPEGFARAADVKALVGVEEALVVVDESLLYLKVDKQLFNEQQLENVLTAPR